MKYLILIITILAFQFGFGQDGRSLILVHNYADKTTIDGITNPTEGNIAYNASDKNIYVFDGTNWVLSSKHLGTAGSIFFAGTDGNPTEDNANLFWEDTSNFLGLGTDAPDSSLHIINTSPDIILDDTSAGYNTISYRRNGADRALVGLENNDDFYISINDGGYHDDAFTIQNSNRFVGISVNEANSTLHVGGSVSKSIIRTQTTGVNLDHTNHTVIITDPSHNIVMPAANATNTGREYIIKNTTDTGATTSIYRDNSDTDTTTIPANNTLKIQSDGVYWNQTNNYDFAISTTTPVTSVGTTTCVAYSGSLTLSTLFGITEYDDEGPNREVYFEYGNGSSPDITEISIVIIDVPYSTFSITNATLDPQTGANVDLTVEPGTTLTTNSGGSCNTTTLYSHVITISGHTIQDGDQILIDFSSNVDGNDGGGDVDTADCTGCIIQFYTD